MQENIHKQESQSYTSDNDEYNDNNCNQYYENYSSGEGSIKSTYDKRIKRKVKQKQKELYKSYSD